MLVVRLVSFFHNLVEHNDYTHAADPALTNINMYQESRDLKRLLLLVFDLTECQKHPDSVIARNRLGTEYYILNQILSKDYIHPLMERTPSLLQPELEHEPKSPIQSFTQQQADDVLVSKEQVRLQFSLDDRSLDRHVEKEVYRSFIISDFESCFHTSGVMTITFKLKIDEHILDYVIKWMYDRLADISRLSRDPNDSSLTSTFQSFDLRDTLQLWMLFKTLGIKFAAVQISKTYEADLENAVQARNYLEIDQYIPHTLEQRRVNNFKEPRDMIVKAIGEFWPDKFTDDFRLPQLANFRAIMPKHYDLRQAGEAAAGNTFEEYKEWKSGRTTNKPEGFSALDEEDKDIVERWGAITSDLGDEKGG